jgi:hypothetical protein
MTGSKKKETKKPQKAKKLQLNKETLTDLELDKVTGGMRDGGGGWPATTCRGSALTCPSDRHCA